MIRRRRRQLARPLSAALAGLLGAGLVTQPVAAEPVAAQPLAAAPVAAQPGAAEPVAQPAAEQAAGQQGGGQGTRNQPPRPHDQLAPLGADEAWQYSTGDDVIVAVLDSGVDADHPDLAGRVLAGRDFVDGSTDGRVDPVGHGTTVASQIAGAGDPATGLAPAATILPVRVLDERNRYRNAATVAAGVRWAVDEGAHVINLSLGGPRDSGVLAEALAYAMANDVVVIACTGNQLNEEYQEIWYPAREPGVVAVAGVTFTDGVPRHWPASLTGPQTVLTAPAVVNGAQAGGGHRDVQGTSFSSALVTGVAALIRARWPELPAGDVVNRLVATAHDAGAPGRDPVYGFGAVDPVAALTAPVAEVPGNPLDTKARYGSSGFGAAPDQRLPSERPEPTGDGDVRDYSVPRPGDGDQAGGSAEAGRPATSAGQSWALLAALTLLPVATAVALSNRHLYRRRSATRQ